MKNYFFIFLFSFVVARADIVLASSVDDLKNKITDSSTEIKNLEHQIAALNKNVQDTVGQKKTLSNELKQIDSIKKKLDVDINVTSKKISLTALNISNLEADIADKTSRIGSSQGAVSESLKMLNDTETTSLVEKILSGQTISNMWREASNLEDLQSKIVGHIKELETTKEGLENDKIALEGEKKKSENLKTQLSDQRNIATQNIAQKNQLIKETNNKEANYRKILADTQARKLAVENELSQYESELSATIAPGSLPTGGTKVLSWPLDVVRITQYFGMTEFSKTQAVYNGRGHNGIDLGAAIGTPLKAAADGTVLGTGDTDPVCYGASYGKWVMIDHHNGLGTIYGHMSLIKVSAGDQVHRGDLIGYSGKTGYATGPHLHFSIVATAAVAIGNLKSKVPSCGTYTIPLGPFNGYLDPLSYL